MPLYWFSGMEDESQGFTHSTNQAVAPATWFSQCQKPSPELWGCFVCFLFYYVYVCACTCERVCRDTHVEVKGHLSGVGFLLPL